MASFVSSDESANSHAAASGVARHNMRLNLTDTDRQIHCKCAIFGVFNAANTEAGQLTYYGLHAQQHRGQESAGILTAKSGNIRRASRFPSTVDPRKSSIASASGKSSPAAAHSSEPPIPKSLLATTTTSTTLPTSSAYHTSSSQSAESSPSPSLSDMSSSSDIVSSVASLSLDTEPESPETQEKSSNSVTKSQKSLEAGEGLGEHATPSRLEAKRSRSPAMSPPLPAHVAPGTGAEADPIEYDQEPSKMYLHKGFGLVLDVFNDPKIFSEKLLGESAIGHTRYSTSGGVADDSAIQPFHVKYKNGNLAVAHNGNITNYKYLQRKLEQEGVLFRTPSDTELLLHLIARSNKKTQPEQVLDALSQIEGAYCFLILTDTYMFAVRDPSGFRPLEFARIGSIDTPGGAAYAFASETCALDLVGAQFIREIEPGEMLALTMKAARTGGKFNSYRVKPKRVPPVAPCVFEYIYFARPDSFIFGQTVDTVRHRTGIQLAQEMPMGPRVKPGQQGPSEDSVVVCAVPDSSNTAALGYANECVRMGYDVHYSIGIIRNHYVGRTFISPGQNARELKVRCKFNIVRRVVKNRVVVMVDDSIVRGTTSRQLVRMMRQAGAKEVHFFVASPPVIGPCFYGMDFPTKGELMATRFSSFEEMRKYLDADSLRYLSVEGMMRQVRVGDPRGQGRGSLPHANTESPYCGACFTGVYPVAPPQMDW